MTDIQAIIEELRRRLDWKARTYDGDTTYDRLARERGRLKHVPRIRCADGFAMSVQASSVHYCTPRASDVDWIDVEVGFPSARAEQLMPYAEDPNDPTGTVYGCVPFEVVAEVIADHGGFAEGQS